MAKTTVEKVKITEIAKELGKKPKDVISKANEIGIIIKSVNSSIESSMADNLYKYIVEGKIPDSKNIEEGNSENINVNKENNKTSTKKITKIKTTKKIEKNDEEKTIQNVKQSIKKQTVTAEMDDGIVKIPTRKVIIVSRNNNQGNRKQETGKVNDILSIADIKDTIKNTIKDTHTSPQKKENKKKENKKLHTTKHTHGTKINIERNLGDTHIEYDDSSEITLIDLNEIDRKIEEKERIEDRVRIQKNNQWFSDSIRRDGKKKRRKWNDTSSTQTQNGVSHAANIVIQDEIRVYEFAEKLGLRVSDIISKLFKMGEMVTKNDFLDRTMVELLAHEFEVKIEISKATHELEYLSKINDEKELLPRPPVITIMGHVDHGKTSLLDYIRKSKITKNEHGGITQQIGAYMVNKDGKDIVFIDTPGHEAFTNMRSRGAQITDIAVIVIAADDGVKKQTIEALSHAKEANVQIIIAVNKIDKENANVDKLKSEMAEIGYNPSDWGGEYDFVLVSAKTGEGVDTLLDTILVQAEIMELKANIKGHAKAIILEGSLDKGKGPIVTVIVQEGVLRIGDNIVADTAYGKVRMLMKDDGRKVDYLKPSQVALLTGLSEVPVAGATLINLDDDNSAKEYAIKRKSYLRAKELSKSTKVSLDDLSAVVAEGKLKPLRLIIKADTQGTLEALKNSLEALSNDEIKVNVISSSVGSINENDINTAQSSQDCYILGFNVKPLPIIKSRAKELNVTIKSHSIIYNLIDEVKDIISNMMKPVVEEEVVGHITIRNIFNVGKGNVIAGCFVDNGIITRDSKIRVIRKGEVIHYGSLASLKRFKDDIKEVSKGYECGIMLNSFNDIATGDTLEIIKENITKQKI